MKIKKFNKTTILVIALILVSIYAVGSTIAWLKDETETITNTFTTAKVDIELTEPVGEVKNYEFIMSPGAIIEKDPKVTVKANSIDSYLFVKITESQNFRNYLSYEVADGWNLVDGENNVYYRMYTSSETDIDYEILKNNQVSMLQNVTANQLNNLQSNYPTLSFTAYAVQMNEGDGDFTVSEAWKIASGMENDNIHSGGSN